MKSCDAKLMREHLLSIKAWLQHWETDRFCKLIPTETSLIYGKHHVDSALALLDRAEAKAHNEPFHALFKALSGLHDDDEEIAQ